MAKSIDSKKVLGGNWIQTRQTSAQAIKSGKPKTITPANGTKAGIVKKSVKSGIAKKN